MFFNPYDSYGVFVTTLRLESTSLVVLRYPSGRDVDTEDGIEIPIPVDTCLRLSVKRGFKSDRVWIGHGRGQSPK